LVAHLAPERVATWTEAQVLVLTRKSNQSIMIGDEIEISVLSVSGDKVRVGITAPRDVPVFRKEVYINIQAEQARKEEASPSDVDEELEDLSKSDDLSKSSKKSAG
jgi:carbon storage regulator